MNDKLREAAQAALDLLNNDDRDCAFAAGILQAPVGKFSKFSDGVWKEVTASSPGMLLYSAPPRREWVGLTDEDKTEIKKLVTYDQFETAGEYANRVQAATESKLKEKNT